MTIVNGQVEPGYESIRDAFKSNFDDQGEVGAAFCLYKDGKKVVDVWGGTADLDGSTAYPEDALQIVFSTTKGATAVCAHMLVDRGALDLDRPVADYWPEFGANGKENIPVRMLLNHRAGLPVIDGQLSLDQVLEVAPVVDALAAQKPVWEPGTKHGYHALTYGWLVGELVKRVSGKSIGTFLQDEIAGPLDLDLWMGLPESEESRVVPLLPAPAPDNPEMLAVMMDPNALLPRALSLNGAFAMVPGAENPFNTRKVHAAEIPAGGGIGTARALARMYAATMGEVDGIRLLSKDAMETARTEQSSAPDEVLMVSTRFGLGFMLQSPEIKLPGSGSYGHAGAGGSLGFADPESGFAFGYIMNQMGSDILIDQRPQRIIEALKGLN